MDMYNKCKNTINKITNYLDSYKQKITEISEIIYKNKESTKSIISFKSSLGKLEK